MPAAISFLSARNRSPEWQDSPSERHAKPWDYASSGTFEALAVILAADLKALNVCHVVVTRDSAGCDESSSGGREEDC